MTMADFQSSVVVVNSVGQRVPHLNFYELASPWPSSKEGFMAFWIFMFAVVVSDHSEFPLTLKVWILLVLWLLQLAWKDIQRGRQIWRREAVETCPQPVDSGTFLGLELSVNNDEFSTLSVVECDFVIHHVKIMDEIPHKPSNNAKDIPSVMLFKLMVSSKFRKWELWRRYEDYSNLYSQLLTRFSKEQVPRLKSFTKLCRNALKETQAPTMSTLTSINTLDRTWEENVRLQQHPAFLQLVARELSRWLRDLKGDLVVGDDDLTRSFFGLPSYVSSIKSKAENGQRLSPGTLSRGRSMSPVRLTNNSQNGNQKNVYSLTMDSVPEVPLSVLTDTATSQGEGSLPDTSRTREETAHHAEDNATVTKHEVKGPQAQSTSHVTSTSVSSSGSKHVSDDHSDASALPAVVDPNAVQTYHLEDGHTTIAWQGTTLDNFSFVDQPSELRQMLRDCRHSHGFKVRGLQYMTNKKKIEAPPAIGQFLHFDVFPVDPSLFGDRHDHVSAVFPMIRHRIRVIQSLEGRPFVITVCFQIPGDPPYTALAYFAIPGDFHPDTAASSELQKAKRLFQRWIDITPVDAQDFITVPDLAAEKNMKTQAKHSNNNSNNSANASTGNNNANNHAHDHPGSTSNNNSNAGSRSTSLDNGLSSDVPVAGEAKILRRIPPFTPSTSSSSATTAKDGIATASSSSSSPAATLSHSKSLPLPRATNPSSHVNTSTTNPTAENAAKTTADNAGSTSPNASTSSNTSSRTPSLGMRHGVPSQWRALQPTKPWGADIAWGTVGDYGNIGNQSLQNKRFKLVPQMLEAPWVVQMAVSSTPCLLGQKIVQRYFRSKPTPEDPEAPDYLEIDLCIGSSGIANNVVGVCRTYAKHFVCNLGVVLQGESEDELPERVLMCMTMSKMDLDAMAALTLRYVDHVHRFVKSEVDKSSSKK